MDKCGFFLCTGCGIGEALDAGELLKSARKNGKAVAAKQHERLCEAAGVQLINAEIAEQQLDAVVIGACSQREMAGVLTFPNVFVDRVSLREQVAWVCKADDEDRQMLAEDYVKMGCIRATKATLPQPQKPEAARALLVIGGGVAGLSASIEAAAAGYRVVLVEKEAELGGPMAKAKWRVPRNPPFAQSELSDVGALIGAVHDNASIEVKTSALVESISGAPGAFEVTLSGGSKHTVGAIVLAAGAAPYDATKLGHLGYGASKNVVTQLELERMAAEGKLVRPSDGRPVRSVLFVQCAGSRDPEHLPYCSNGCCPTSIKQAAVVRELSPGARVYVLYKDLRTPGLLESYYRESQKAGTVFIKGAVEKLEANGGAVHVQASDVLSGDTLDIEVDLVVLATGLVPATRDAEILKLTYRLGKELPVREGGFPNSHFICFPYETQRTGIYAAGNVRHPMGEADALADGAGAALKAIQCVEMSARGEAVHPRATDITWPEFFLQRCTQCKRCTEECPFGTLDEDEKGTPKPNPTRCRRCGVCMGACPERIISFANYSVDMVGSMLKSMSVPDEFEEKPRVLCFVCENDALPAIDMAAQMRKELSPWVRFIPLRCLGSTNLQWINDALLKGIDGVMLVGCKYGDDYQCHFVKGSELCNVRLSKIQETLTRLMLEPERIRLEQFQIGDYEKLFDVVNGFVKTVAAMPPNPNK
jgi:quinone-modifying oxidoreductase subunit QmoB